MEVPMGRSALLLALVVGTTTWTSAAWADVKTDKMIIAAWREATALSTQVEIYKLNNGSYPKSIKALTQKQPKGGSPLVAPEKVIDPWGRPYEIDPKGPMNEGIKADVWSKGPNPKDPKGRIGNWPS